LWMDTRLIGSTPEGTYCTETGTTPDRWRSTRARERSISCR
jgi:hypothetical protein